MRERRAVVALCMEPVGSDISTEISLRANQRHARDDQQTGHAFEHERKDTGWFAPEIPHQLMPFMRAHHDVPPFVGTFWGASERLNVFGRFSRLIHVLPGEIDELGARVRIFGRPSRRVALTVCLTGLHPMGGCKQRYSQHDHQRGNAMSRVARWNNRIAIVAVDGADAILMSLHGCLQINAPDLPLWRRAEEV